MPNMDRTGPEGKGPKTGNRRGLCSSDELKELDKELDNVENKIVRRGRGYKKRRRLGQ